MGPEGESLGDISASSGELNSELGKEESKKEQFPFQPAQLPQGVLQQLLVSRIQRWHSHASPGS